MQLPLVHFSCANRKYEIKEHQRVGSKIMESNSHQNEDEKMSRIFPCNT
jgi:hypothetical protein